ncbi:MAG: glycosyltransferase family A protein [Planctomycetota bacterium]
MISQIRLHRPASDRPKDLPVGVVIPVYNRRTLLLETLPFVLAQTHAPERVVIVDDGSTDGSADAAEAWLAGQQPQFAWRVLRCPHRTAAAARVDGFRLVDDLPLVAFLDSDDHWPSDFLERTVAHLAANPEADAAVTDRRYIDAAGAEQASDCSQMATDPFAWLFQHGAGIASCSLLRTAAVKAAGGWQPELRTAEDAWLFGHVAMQGEWVHVPGEPVTFHLGNANSRNEDGNLSRRYADTELRWVRVYQQLYHLLGERRPDIDRRPLQAALAKRWARAGKQMFRTGQANLARECFSQAVYWNPTQLKSWGRLAISPFVRGQAA